MSEIKYGKVFEADIKSSLKKIKWPVIRLKDVATNFGTRTKNPCDFITYHCPNMFMLELKSYQGTAIPLDKITQLEQLLEFDQFEGIVCGALLNFRKYDKTFFVFAKDLGRITDRKSVSFKFCEQYGIEIESQIKRTRPHYHLDKLKELTEHGRN